MVRAADSKATPPDQRPAVKYHEYALPTSIWRSSERVAFRSSCEARLCGDGGEGTAELKMSGRTSKESGFDRLFLLVDSLSDVDSIALFPLAALGLAASCTDAWLSQEQFELLHLSSWRLRRLMGHGQWICGRWRQGCTGIGSVSRVCAAWAE